MATKHMPSKKSHPIPSKQKRHFKKTKSNTEGDSKERKENDILQSIIELGGEKTDLNLVEDVDDDESEALDWKEDLDAEPVKKDEIREFIKNLGIRDHRPQEKEGEEKKDKNEKEIKQPVLKSSKKEETAGEKCTSNRKERKNKFKSQIQDGEVSSTTETVSLDISSEQTISLKLKTYKARKYSLLKTEGSWFEQLSKLDNPRNSVELSDTLLQEMEKFASKLLQDEVDLYKNQRERFKKSETKWIKTVLTSGTLGDKMAALTLLVQDSPVNNLSSLDSLIAMANKKGKRECILAVDTLKELFQSELIPSNRKLREFKQNNFGSLLNIDPGDRDLFDRTLLLWGFESQFKERYFSFIKALELLSFDSVPISKQKALSAIYNLLVNKPEQEKKLLSMLVNKVGDPDHKLAAKSSHLLSTLVDHHPNMKTVVVKETEQLLYRPNISSKAQYYAICFLNQLVLSHEEKDLANRLIELFFSFFKAFVKKGEVDSKIMSALLTGVNRVYPYAKVDYDRISSQMNTLYQIVHVVNFNTSLQALMLLYQVMDSSQSVSDRYYMALYKKLLDPSLKASSKQTMFLNLLYKSLKQDVSEKRIKAFVKRLLQVCSYQTPQFICATLILLSEVVQVKKEVLQVMNLSGKWLEDDDEDEHFTDVIDDDDNNTDGEKQDETQDEGEKTNQTTSASSKSSWVHRSNLADKSHHYNPQHRNPLYCCVDQECMWELDQLSSHYHPTVALFAQTLLQGKPISYSGDPLHDFALIRFLDRFVYKNPKKQRTASAQEREGRFSRGYQTTGVKLLPVNSEEFLKKGERNIPVEERFFYKYFQQKAGQNEKKKKRKDDDSDVESVDDDEFEQFLDGYEKHVDGEGGVDLRFDFAGEFDKQTGKQKKKKVKKSEFDDSDDDDDDMAGLSDEEVEFSDDPEFNAAFDEDEMEDMEGQGFEEGDLEDMEGQGFEEGDLEDMEGQGFEEGDLEDMECQGFEEGDFDEENVEFSDEDNELAEFEATPQFDKSSKRKHKKEGVTKKTKKAKTDNTGGLFAAAEEFSHLIDENSGSKLDQSTSQALSNKDNAHVKQLNWEVNRDKWVRGADWKSKRKINKGKNKFQKGPSKFKKGPSNKKLPKQSKKGGKRS